MSDPTLTLTEIYRSIQGESTWAGLPCIFVRLTGCNLRCSWCDSAFAFHGGKKMTLPEILAEVAGLAPMPPAPTAPTAPAPSAAPASVIAPPSTLSLVEVTGGEPLLQPHTPDLCAALLAAGHTVLIETSGERPIETLPAGVIRIMDLKAPGSGESHRNRLENIAHLTARDEVKCVLASREDYLWAREMVQRHRLDTICTVLFSTVFGALQPADLVAWILADGLNVRFQLQLHKFVWDPMARRT
ncbi:MAG: 7-carboxy-7-deazaguanine synthase QueE [Planctomycetota bacterium]